MAGSGITITSFKRLCFFSRASCAFFLNDAVFFVSKVDGISMLTESGGSSRVMVEPGGSDRI